MPSEAADDSHPFNNDSVPALNGSGSDDERTPFERFADLTKQILAVPKAEMDKRREKAKRPGSTST